MRERTNSPADGRHRQIAFDFAGEKKGGATVSAASPGGATENKQFPVPAGRNRPEIATHPQKKVTQHREDEIA